MVKEQKEIKLDLNRDSIPKLLKKWEWDSNSVDEINIINLIQFLNPEERIHFVNELWRVLKIGAKAHVTIPHWASARAYGDLAFVYPPVTETWFFHLNKDWRKGNAPWGIKYKCDFDFTLGYGMHPLLCNRNQEYQQHALTFWREAAQDLMATLIKRE
jgi:hypothetical protein